ncbi:MAG: redoxin domain-containing protein [Phycisphaerales bacterium]|jgi:peroxiredoxin
MNRYLISTGAIFTVLLVACAAFGQNEGNAGQMQNRRRRLQNMSEENREKFLEEMRQRRARWENMSEEEKRQLRAQMRERIGSRFGLRKEEQLKAVEAIQEQLKKFKASLQNVDTEEARELQEFSEEERAKFNEKMAQVARERQATIRSLERQITILRGPRQRSPEPRMPINELRAIYNQAIEEKAAKTAEHLSKLISQYQDESRAPGTRRPRQRPERLERPPRPRRGANQSSKADKRAPDFELSSFDGKQIRLSDYRGKIVVLEWMNTECPFSRYHYETKNTMVALANKYKNKNVVWLAINSTNHTTPEANKTFASKHKLPYVLLDDRPGKVGRLYGAETTPHIFIINTNGRIVYEGAIDNSPMGKNKEGIVNYVDNALAELTAGKAVSTAKTKPYGCTVKYAK